MRRTAGTANTAGGTNAASEASARDTNVASIAPAASNATKPGIIRQLRNPPGGRDARTMLVALFLDRAGTGVWAAAAVLYFTFVVGLDAGHVGLLLGLGGAAGIAGSPLAGWLAGRYRVRSLLIASHLFRLGAASLLLVGDSFATLLPVVAGLCVGDRAAKTWEMLFATRTAGEKRATYRAMSRVMMNAGYGIGAGVAALGLAIGTRDAYRALVIANAASFLAAALLVARIDEPQAGRSQGTEPQGADGLAPPVKQPARANPWRDPRYLLFVLLDTPMNLDDSILSVGLPLWLVSRTTAPHAVIPAFLVINTLMVVLLQMPLSARVEGPRRAADAVAAIGLAVLACCALIAVSSSAGTIGATVLLLAAAVVLTLAELMRSVSSWELAISLAPEQAQPAYLGVAGMSTSVARSGGPILLADVVLAAGPAGWLAFGTAMSGLSLVQRRFALRRLDAMRSQVEPPRQRATAEVTPAPAA